MELMERDIESTLLYYDLWQYPLTTDELYAFLPRNSMTLGEFKERLRENGPGPNIVEKEGYYYLNGRTADVVSRRKEGERRARFMWRMARVATSLIRRFPFVRGIMVSGDLSKNLATRESDVDFFIVTAPNRLWIARSLLILFKKVFLLNRKKFFCLNTFITSDNLALDERNIYVAAEVAYLKPVYNYQLFQDFERANSWIRDYFPNFNTRFLPSTAEIMSEGNSVLQRILEIPFALLPSDRLDTFLLRAMERVWKNRYPELDDARRARSFRTTKTDSRTYPRDYQDMVLSLYAERSKAGPQGRRHELQVEHR
jgi:hypothetical protein